MKKIYILKATVFLSAFLLFQIELIISKILLPKFGGTYLVWGAACVFFQASLLIGYLYSHLMVRKFGMHIYRYFHIGILLLSFFFFPGRPLAEMHLLPHAPLVFNIFSQLFMAIGFAFLILSTTNIIFHSWLSASQLAERHNPYILYGISNLGSFAGILTYPFFFESSFDLDQQLRIWRIAFWAMVGLHLMALKLISIKKESAMDMKVPASGVGKKNILYWLLLSAAGNIIFLSVTNILTYEVAPIPLLWTLPLCIYLISFVLNFQKNPWCPGWISKNFHITVGLSVLIFFFCELRIFPFLIAAAGFLVSLFIICMRCQYLLHESKPADLSNLTIFYVIISIGGVLGGILVSWVVPLINTTSMIEYLIGLVFISLALVIDKKDTSIDLFGLRLVMYALLILLLWPLVFKYYNVFGIVFIIAAFKYIFSRIDNKAGVFNIGLIFILCLAPTLESFWTRNIPMYHQRNYYGIYKVYDTRGVRVLMHGTTIHGAQYVAKEKSKEALTYFHRDSPVGTILSSSGSLNKDYVGIVGLGTATLLVYIDKNQTVDYFEIDPSMYELANKYFSFLKDCPGKVNVILGDARLSIKDIPDKRYNILIIDAFSGDSIPIHLLTTEAIAQYRRCLANDGIILFHVSNRYLSLTRVIAANANALNAFFCHKSHKGSGNAVYSSDWTAMTWDPDAFQKLTTEFKWEKFPLNAKLKKMRPWTDKYSNLSGILSTKNLLVDIKEFQPFYW